MAIQKATDQINRRMFIKGMAAAAGTIASVSLLAACGATPTPVPPSATPKPAPTAAPAVLTATPAPKPAATAVPVAAVQKGGTCTTAYGKPPLNSFSFINNISTAQNMVMFPVFNTLFRGQDWGDTMEISGKVGLTMNLAAAVKEEEKDRKWTVSLRKDVKWHDGQPFNADDVVWTYYAGCHKDTQSTIYATVSEIKGAAALKTNGGDALEGVKKIDDYTVSIELEKPTPAMLTAWNRAWFVLPKHSFTGIPLNQILASEAAMTKVIGTGPFKIKRIVPDQYVEMEANKDYFKGAPLLDSYVVRWMAGDASDAGLEAGEIDGAWAATTQSFERLSKLPQLVGVTQTNPFPQGLHLSYGKLPNADQLNLAVLYATDRVKISKELTGGTSVVTDNIFAHVNLGDLSQDPPCLTHFTYDPDKAKAILKAINWDSNRKIQWTVWTPPTAVFLAIQAMCAAVGLNFEFKTIDSSVLGKVLADGDYEALFSNQGGVDDMKVNSLYTRCGQTYAQGYYNSFQYCNPELDAAWDAAMAEPDAAKQLAAYKQLACTWQKKLPMALMFRTGLLNVYNRRVQGAYFRNNYAKTVETPFERIWIKKS